MKNRYTLFLILALGLIGAMIAATLLTRQPYQFQGSLISPASPAPDFSLIAPDGSAFRLSDQRGKIVLIFFGYTQCPDVCPVTLAEYRKIIQNLGARSQQVVYLFITVDPDRDTSALLGQHTALFDPAILGLTGDQTTLEMVWKAYGVVREIQETGGAAGYLVDHTARLYLVDKQGRLRVTYPFGFGVDGILKDLAYLLDEP